MKTRLNFTFKSHLWSIGLALLALALRLFQLSEWSWWHDEALTVLLAQKSLNEIVAITAADVHPPLYYFIIKLYLTLGQNEFTVRLPSALFGTGAVVGLYCFGRDLFDEWVGLIGAGLLALSPLQLFYSQEARMYTQLLFFTIFSAWSFWRALRENDWLWWGLFTVSAVLACYTAYFAFPVLGAMLLYVFGVDRRRDRMKRFLIAGSVVFLLYLPWLGIFLSQTGAVSQTYWIAPPHPLLLFTTLAGFFTGTTLPPWGLAVAIAATLLILFVALNGARHALRRRVDVKPLLWLLLWGFVPLLGLFLISLTWVPLFQLRTVIIAAPAFYLLVAWTISRTPYRKFNLLLFLPLLGMMLLASFNFYFNPAFAKPPWREAAYYVESRVQPGDVVLHTSPGSFLPFLAYRPSVAHYLLPDPVIVQENAPSQAIVTAVAGPSRILEEVATGPHRIWLVVGLDQSLAYQQAQKQRLEARYHRLAEKQLTGIYISIYEVTPQP